MIHQRQSLCAFQMCMKLPVCRKLDIGNAVSPAFERMLSHFKGDYDRQNKEAAGNRAIVITHFPLGFEGQRF